MTSPLMCFAPFLFRVGLLAIFLVPLSAWVGDQPRRQATPAPTLPGRPPVLGASVSLLAPPRLALASSTGSADLNGRGPKKISPQTPIRKPNPLGPLDRN